MVKKDKKMVDVVNFYDYKKENSSKKPINKFKIWHSLPIKPINNSPYEIIVRLYRSSSSIPNWAYMIVNEDEIMDFNNQSSELIKGTANLIQWAYIEDIEKLINDFENPQIS